VCFQIENERFIKFSGIPQYIVGEILKKSQHRMDLTGEDPSNPALPDT